MPCYTVNLMTVEFNMKNINILKKALEKLGYNYRYGEKTNQLDIPSMNASFDLKNQNVSIPRYYSDDLNKIKRAYSETVVEEIAKKKKWIIKKMGNKLQLRRY